ncbi:glycosyltransferase family 4 protein [Myceligenerans salitolerans]|uniref:Glycosyltransferase family 4 protein n=1 Tax=Myceligenerans salitolerans TaxID=1230528 RepID=A0ABS3I833_9MICO|nr:glycosyltransferase family 4 protein [Myceligenerans salitolerans]MBO0609177.1 glycosyltransferase family 4 protein [Myceligenerans salitolerans]
MTTRRPQLLVFPRWSDNPYLSMLYLAAEADGWRMRGTTSLQGFEQWATDRLDPGDVAHVHWTNPVLSGCESDDEAREHLARFRTALRTLRERGIRLLWTVHNEFAHDARFPELEKEIAQALTENATAIIQLHDHTAAAVEHAYRLPADKLVTVRHSSYAGVYPDTWTREQARAELGVPADAFAVGFTGRIRPYKGVDILCAAVERAAARIPNIALLLAGYANPSDAAAVEEVLPTSVPVVKRLSFVPDEELGLWLRASDIMALPYQRILNSGSALLACSFGTPVIVPGPSTLATVYEGQQWVRTYASDGDQAGHLAEALVAAHTDLGPASAAATRYAQAYTPWSMSRDFLAVLDSLPTTTAPLTPSATTTERL